MDDTTSLALTPKRTVATPRDRRNRRLACAWSRIRRRLSSLLPQIPAAHLSYVMCEIWATIELELLPIPDWNRVPAQNGSKPGAAPSKPSS